MPPPLVRQLGVGPVVAVGYSMGGPIALHLDPPPPRRRRRPRRPGDGAGVERHPPGTGAVARAARRRLVAAQSRGYRRYLNRAVPKLLGVDHPLEPYVPWLLSEMSRNDAFAMVDAGRALSRYDARPWASTLHVPAASLITTQDRLVRPSKQRALAEALGASRRELAADHLAALSHPARVRRAHRRAGRPRRPSAHGRRRASRRPAPDAA